MLFAPRTLRSLGNPIALASDRKKKKLIIVAPWSTSPTDQQGNIFLSNNNKTANNRRTTGSVVIRGSVSKITGDFIFGIIVNAVSPALWRCGIQTSPHSLSSHLGNTIYSIGITAGGLAYYNNATIPGTTGTIANGSTIAVRYVFSSHTTYFYVNGVERYVTTLFDPGAGVSIFPGFSSNGGYNGTTNLGDFATLTGENLPSVSSPWI